MRDVIATWKLMQPVQLPDEQFLLLHHATPWRIQRGSRDCTPLTPWTGDRLWAGKPSRYV